VLIVGLGNPPDQYGSTRHNAGYWFVDLWAHSEGLQWRYEKKCDAWIAKNSSVFLIKPSCFINLSSGPIRKTQRYFNLENRTLVVAHDEMSFLPGVIRFKENGGAGGHNGLKDIISHIGENFMRIRIGIGSPNHPNVSDYVLSNPAVHEKNSINESLANLIAQKEKILEENWPFLMNNWHQS
jgi:PTH1 family peptidyl-tRNA hydrolase|tara:strand:- start:5375 stop:5920 length:546 start_codon:yes stop_codon:yes gene_type:complete